MDNERKYEEVLDKYELINLKDDYLNHFKNLREREKTVGIFGEGKTVIQVVADIFELPELKEIMFPGAFYIQFWYGEGKGYQTLEGGVGKDCSFEEFAEKMQDVGGLEMEDFVFEGRIILPNDNLNSLKVIVATFSEIVDDEFLLSNDVCAVALSATHMLSLRERSFIRNPLNMFKCYFLCDIEAVREDEREKVKSLLDAYLSNGEKCYMIPFDDDCNAIFQEWMAADIYENRVAAVNTYFKPKIVSAIQEKLYVLTHEGTLINQILITLESAKGELPKYKDKTVRYINTNYIDGIKNNTSSDILGFYEKLNDDITEGIREEKNMKAIQEELPNFIVGAWTEFLDKSLNVQVQENVDMVLPAIEEYVDEKSEMFLKGLLTEEEFSYINTIVSSGLKEGDISGNEIESVLGNATLDRKDNMTLRRVLPKCLMVLGGIAVLSSSFLPGALLMAAGYKGNRDVLEETQDELIEAGKKLNHKYLKEVQSEIEELIKRVKALVEATVEQCYSNIIDTLIQMIQLYREKTRENDEKAARISADMEEL